MNREKGIVRITITHDSAIRILPQVFLSGAVLSFAETEFYFIPIKIRTFNFANGLLARGSIYESRSGG